MRRGFEDREQDGRVREVAGHLPGEGQHDVGGAGKKDQLPVNAALGFRTAEQK